MEKKKVIALLIIFYTTLICVNIMIWTIPRDNWNYISMPKADWYWDQIEPQLDADDNTLINLLNKEVLKENRTTDGHLDVQDVYDIQQFIHSQIKSYDKNYTVMDTIRERRGDCTEKAFLQYQLLQAENQDNMSRVYIVLLLMHDAEAEGNDETLNHASSFVLFNSSFMYSDAMLFDASWYLNMTNIFNESYNCADFGTTQMHMFALIPILQYEIGFLLSEYDCVRFTEDQREDDNFHVCKWIYKQWGRVWM